MKGWRTLNLLRRDASWWFSRMRSDARRSDDARHYTNWLNRDEANKHQIRMLEMVWNLSGELRSDSAINRLSELNSRAGMPRSVRYALVAGIIAVVAVCASLMYWPINTYETTLTTRVGQQSEFELPDRSLVFLNTASTVRVRYSGFHRAIFIEHGEATFNVSKSHWRPFEVTTRFGVARALGTRFDVFLRPVSMQVLIVDGTVGIQPANYSDGESPKIVRSGEVAVIDASAHVTIARADLAPILDKRVQQLEFDRARIADAVAEFNQYGRIALHIDPSIADLRISGVFKVGDSQAFVDSLVATLNLAAVNQNGQTTLIRR